MRQGYVVRGAEHGKERYRSRSQSATRAIEVVGVDAGVGDDAVVVVVVVVAGVDDDDDAELELDDVIEEETVGEAVGHVLLLLNVVDLG